MPQLGETVTEGTITKWHKRVGDEVVEDEVLFEVSTDKVDSEVPSPVSGTVDEILVQEGETVSVGTKLAVIGQGGAAAPQAARNGRCGQAGHRPRRPPRRPPPAAGAVEAAGDAEAPDEDERPCWRRRRARYQQPPPRRQAGAGETPDRGAPQAGFPSGRPTPSERSRPGWPEQAAVPGGPPAHRRARARPGRDRGFGRRRPDHPR